MKLISDILDGITSFLGGIFLTLLMVGGLYYYTDHLVISCKPRACLVYIQ